QAMLDADALPYLFNQLPSDLEMRVRIANPPTVNAFFTELCNIWHESAGKRIQAPAPTSVSFTTQPQKDDFKIRLARDLAYTGIGIDDATLENFIYEELKKRLGGTTAHVRKSPFTSRSAYATKKVIRKVVPKASAKQTRHCSACGKAGHTKVNCPKGKRTKKVNYVYQDEVEDPEDSEEYIVEEEVVEEEEIEDDEEYDEYVDKNDDEPRNCYASKKKWCEKDRAKTKERATKKSPTSKSHTSNIVMAENYMFQIALKSTISSLVPHCPREILIEISKFINMIFTKIKDHCLNTAMSNDTVKRRELAWGNVISKFEDILFPLLQAVNSEQKPLLQ
ncbi:2824_t:CDS:2, partial [Rhizophagus irregularis]